MLQLLSDSIPNPPMQLDIFKTIGDVWYKSKISDSIPNPPMQLDIFKTIGDVWYKSKNLKWFRNYPVLEAAQKPIPFLLKDAHPGLSKMVQKLSCTRSCPETDSIPP
ncbi:hypothetical protein QE152_g8130 [Popillia japonica]|uniref:Uncharacterized protein n=1 Tax=Popillia japonica TaxID=7064 RepID=A0AAW1M5K9_POPJA